MDKKNKDKLNINHPNLKKFRSKISSVSKKHLEKNSEKFKILTIDGGGLRGVFTIYAIWKLKEEFDIDVFKEFDMFVGTSTGAIIAASILIGVDFKQLFESYIERPNHIFKRNDFIKQINQLFLAKYKSEPFKNALNVNLKGITFDEFDKLVKKPYIFTATNISEAKPVIFASNHFKSVNNRYRNFKVEDAIYSSSAAPFYFQPMLEKYTDDIIADGGLWSNNPSSVALVYAIGDLDILRKNIQMLSFGHLATQNTRMDIKQGLFKTIANSATKDRANNQANALMVASIASKQNFDTLTTIITLQDSLFRYSPDKIFPKVKVDKLTDEYIDYVKEFWEENKEKVVKFIKTGKNEFYSENDKKMYN